MKLLCYYTAGRQRIRLKRATYLLSLTIILRPRVNLHLLISSSVSWSYPLKLSHSHAEHSLTLLRAFARRMQTCNAGNARGKQLRPISALRFWICEGWLKHNLNLKGWNSHVHRGFPWTFESNNLSRENRSREIGRTGAHWNSRHRAACATIADARRSYRVDGWRAEGRRGFIWLHWTKHLHVCVCVCVCVCFYLIVSSARHIESHHMTMCVCISLSLSLYIYIYICIYIYIYVYVIWYHINHITARRHRAPPPDRRARHMAMTRSVIWLPRRICGTPHRSLRGCFLYDIWQNLTYLFYNVLLKHIVIVITGCSLYHGGRSWCSLCMHCRYARLPYRYQGLADAGPDALKVTSYWFDCELWAHTIIFLVDCTCTQGLNHHLNYRMHEFKTCPGKREFVSQWILLNPHTSEQVLVPWSRLLVLRLLSALRL